MSTLAVNTVTDANGGNTATINSMTPTADSLQGFRNRLINSDMRIDQRNAGASVTPSSSLTYTLDRWRADMSVGSKFSVQQSSTAPAGFSNSLLITSTSAYTVDPTDYFALTQPIEGFNTADLNFGSVNAKTVILSFWVRSSVTGTYSGVLVNSNDTRVYPYSYTISVADTWEYKTVTIAGDTSGTWQTTSSAGIRVQFYIGLGTNFQGTLNAWNSGTVYGASGTTNLVSTNGATFYITGVQLEVGSVATPFERRPYGQELSLCQRYYIKYLGTGNNFASGANYTTADTYPQLFFPVTMRAAPTFSFSGVDAFEVYSAGSSIGNTTGLSHGPTIFGHTIAASRSGLTSGYASIVTLRTNAFLAYSAEL